MASKTAQQRTKNREESNPGESWWIESYGINEIVALIIGGVSAMVLLSLYSYSPSDLPKTMPAWVPFSHIEGPSQFGGNFVGPFGAIVAGFLYFSSGAAGYLVPTALILWAIQMVTTRRGLGIRNFIALSLLVVSAACLVDCQKFFFGGWVERYQLPGSPGGWVGYHIGNDLLVKLFGPAGSFIIMGIVAILTLIVVTGIHPFRFFRKLNLVFSRFFKGINWEKKWSLWSGLSPLDDVFPANRIGTAPRTISIISTLSDDFSFDTPPLVVENHFREVAVQEFEPDAVSVQEVAKSVVSKVGRARKIIDSSQKRHTDGSLLPEIRKEKVLKPKFHNYELPSVELLSYAKELDPSEISDEALIQIQNLIIGTLQSFKVDVEPGDITRGPTITRYEVYPSAGLRVNKITTLKDDIARATRAERVNILAPIPGKDTVGIEIANSVKATVALRELFESEAFYHSTARLPLVLGKDVYGQTIVGDLAKMPHLLVAGATGSGKSVCINTIIASLLYRFTPDELKFIMIDPKVVEMQLYNDLPHMVLPVVTEPKKVLLALRWVINEMESRYAMFAKKGVRNFESFNTLRSREVKAREQAEQARLQPDLFNFQAGDDFFRFNEEDLICSDFPESLPYIVVIIDELADLMQTAQADVETAIARIAQKARAAGIHLIIATQTPRADVITGTIKANIPSRIAFQVSSKTDSRIILDENGAENLVGKGDMLYLPPGSAQLIRVQGALITDEEAHALVKACATQGAPHFEDLDSDGEGFGQQEEENEEGITDADEVVITKCMEVIFSEKKASTSLLQRKLRLGYTRAARMIDILEKRGIIGPGDGARPRDILVDLSSDHE